MESGRERWLKAGQELLREGGPRAVKIDALAERSGLTTGSFYHNFSGMAAFLDDLARYYGVEQTEEHLRTLADRPARERLAGLARIAADRQMQPLDAAMRDWAGSNELAADAVAAADAALFEFVADAFAELGHSRNEARIRAALLLSAGVARLEAPWALPRNLSSRILEIVLDAP